jgi:hypothetical protein
MQRQILIPRIFNDAVTTEDDETVRRKVYGRRPFDYFTVFSQNSLEDTEENDGNPKSG